MIENLTLPAPKEPPEIYMDYVPRYMVPRQVPSKNRGTQ